VIKRIVSLLVFLLVVNAGVRVGLVYFHDQNFRDAVREIALFGAGKPDELLRGKVMSAAADNSITTLDPDFVEIQRKNVVGVGDHVVIRYAYALMVRVAPGYERRFEFDYSTP